MSDRLLIRAGHVITMDREIPDMATGDVLIENGHLDQDRFALRGQDLVRAELELVRHTPTLQQAVRAPGGEHTREAGEARPQHFPQTETDACSGPSNPAALVVPEGRLLARSSQERRTGNRHDGPSRFEL
jgi:hypothetical protein